MALEAACLRCYCGKAHPHLESHARFLWDHGDRTACLDHAKERFVEASDVRLTLAEQGVEIELPA
jgi:histone H3/H4